MWVPHDVRDLVVDFVRYWSEKTEIGAGRFIHWLKVDDRFRTTVCKVTAAWPCS